MSRHSCITLPDDSVVINGGEYDFMSHELARMKIANDDLREEIRRLRDELGKPVEPAQ